MQHNEPAPPRQAPLVLPAMHLPRFVAGYDIWCSSGADGASYGLGFLQHGDLHTAVDYTVHVGAPPADVVTDRAQWTDAHRQVMGVLSASILDEAAGLGAVVMRDGDVLYGCRPASTWLVDVHSDIDTAGAVAMAKNAVGGVDHKVVVGARQAGEASDRGAWPPELAALMERVEHDIACRPAVYGNVRADAAGRLLFSVRQAE